MEACIAVTSEDACACPFGIYDDDTLVGFLMIGYNESGIGPDAPEALKGNKSLRRLMIGKDHQGRSCSREAVRRAPGFIRTWPRGKALLPSRKRGGKEAVRLIRI